MDIFLLILIIVFSIIFIICSQISSYKKIMIYFIKTYEDNNDNSDENAEEIKKIKRIYYNQIILLFLDMILLVLGMLPIILRHDIKFIWFCITLLIIYAVHDSIKSHKSRMTYYINKYESDDEIKRLKRKRYLNTILTIVIALITAFGILPEILSRL